MQVSIPSIYSSQIEFTYSYQLKIGPTDALRPIFFANNLLVLYSIVLLATMIV